MVRWDSQNNIRIPCIRIHTLEPMTAYRCRHQFGDLFMSDLLQFREANKRRRNADVYLFNWNPGLAGDDMEELHPDGAFLTVFSGSQGVRRVIYSLCLMSMTEVATLNQGGV